MFQMGLAGLSRVLGWNGHGLLWVAQSALPYGVSWVALGCLDSKSWCWGWSGCRVALGQASSMVLASRVVVRNRVPSGLLSLWDSRMLCPSGW